MLCLSMVFWERWLETPSLRPAGNKKRELRERENPGDLPNSQFLSEEGGQHEVYISRPDHGGKMPGRPCQEGESGAPIAGGIFMAFWSVLL